MPITRVAVSQRVVENSTYPERRDALDQEWVRWLQRVLSTVHALPVPNGIEDIRLWLDNLNPEALILTGGNDWQSAPERDRTESYLVDWFRGKGRPIFGVCRGLHVLNALFGGTIPARLADLTPMNHLATIHPLELRCEPFAAMAGSAEILVNSYHHEGIFIDQLASSLNAFAVGIDNVVEGVVHDEEPILAIQWHPERSNPSAAEFDSLLIAELFEHGTFWRPS